MITSAELNLYQNDFLWHINPYVRKAFYDRLMPHQVIGERIIYDYELLYIKSGRCVVTIEDQQYETQPGDLYFFRLCLHELSGIMALSQRRGCHHGEITASA